MSSARLAIETDAELVDPADVLGRPGGGPTHSDSLMNGVPVSHR